MTDITKSEIDSAEAAQVVNTIVLWRIYDTLLMILNQLGGDAAGLGRLHEAGQFIGPNPAVTLEEEGPIDLVADQAEPGK